MWLVLGLDGPLHFAKNPNCSLNQWRTETGKEGTLRRYVVLGWREVKVPFRQFT